jgi:hypothetical protein
MSAAAQISLAVVDNGKVVSATGVEAPVPWWSFTKTVIAASALVLVRDGVVGHTGKGPGSVIAVYHAVEQGQTAAAFHHRGRPCLRRACGIRGAARLILLQPCSRRIAGPGASVAARVARAPGPAHLRCNQDEPHV